MQKKNKVWKIKPLKGKGPAEFFPVFEVNTEDETVETRFIDLKIGGEEYRFNYLDIYMFLYFCGNEEMRRGLALRHEKQSHFIPYEVTFKLDKEEIDKGEAKRRIELPIDQLTMAIAKNEEQKRRYKKILGRK